MSAVHPKVLPTALIRDFLVKVSYFYSSHPYTQTETCKPNFTKLLKKHRKFQDKSKHFHRHLNPVQVLLACFATRSFDRLGNLKNHSRIFGCLIYNENRMSFIVLQDTNLIRIFGTFFRKSRIFRRLLSISLNKN